MLFSERGHATDPALLLRSGDWAAYSLESATSKTCFAVSANHPATASPAARVLVSAWPREKIKAEASFSFAANVPPASAAVVIGDMRFALMIRHGRGYIADPAEERRLVAAMRTGSDLSLLTVSETGTTSKQLISLKGIGQTLQAIALCK